MNRDERLQVWAHSLSRYDLLGGKAVQGMNTLTERRFCCFLDALGVRAADGGHLYGEALNAEDGPGFERGLQLWRGEVKPETELERRELARWRGAGAP